MILTDVFGQAQVMQLARPGRKRQVTMVTEAGRVVTTETHMMWRVRSKHFHLWLEVILATHTRTVKMLKASNLWFT